MKTQADYYADVKLATIRQSDRGSVVFLVMGLVRNINIKTGKLRR